MYFCVLIDYHPLAGTTVQMVKGIVTGAITKIEIGLTVITRSLVTSENATCYLDLGDLVLQEECAINMLLGLLPL